MTRKCKKFLTKILLMIITVSTLLSCFVISGSADETDYIGTWNNSVPMWIFYRDRVDDPDLRDTSLWNVPKKVKSTDRITFGLMGTGDINTNPWHIFPFVQGQQSSSGTNSVVAGYNKLVDDMGYVSMPNFSTLTSILNSLYFDSYISYSSVADDRIQFIISFRLKDGVNWTRDWRPIYGFWLEFIDVNGTLSEHIVQEGTGTTMGVVSHCIYKVNDDITARYPYIDVAMLMRYVYGYGTDLSTLPSYGVKLTTFEFFYNKTGSYPDMTGSPFNSSWYQNLYTGVSGYNSGIVSYGYNYYFENSTVEARQQYLEGYNDGNSTGYNNGYLAGKQFGIIQGENYNAVDGILTLAQVPSTFISSMLDFNFFGINLAHTVKVIFTVLIIAFIVVLLVKFLL